MDSACDKVFAIPELVHKLAINLTQAELSNLMQTSHRLHALCLASFYHDMNCHIGYLIDSSDALHAFARNVQYVRSLDTGRAFSVYYFNAVLAFYEMTSRLLLSRDSDEACAFSRPQWVPPPDPRPCLLIPFPPMTHLTHLSVQIGLDYVQDGFGGECFLDRFETTNHVTQVCWILHLNPNLIQVSISGIPTKDTKGLHVLAETISKLNRLEKLVLGLIGREVLWTLLAYSYFLACPRSIQALTVELEEPTFYDDGLERIDTAVRNVTGWDFNHEGARELDNLTFLELENLVYLTTEEVCEVFRDCPNLQHLMLPILGSQVDIVTVGRVVGKSCPKLTEIISKAIADGRRRTLVLEIMESMVAAPALEKFVFVGSFEVSDRLSAAFRRHAATLTWVQFDLHKDMEPSFIQLLLFECPNLEGFVLGGVAEWMTDEPTLTVSEVVERKWASSRIKELRLQISIGDLFPSFVPALTSTAAGVNEDDETPVPYYLRPTPILFTEQEQRHMTVLEKFYKQLGEQTALEVLELWRVEPTSNTDNDDSLRDLTFPALLSLGDPVARRPGFLDLWGGLKKLKVLQGSFNSFTDENRAIVGMREVQWMAEAWPKLEEANFCPEPPYGEGELLPHFKWLSEVRPEIMLY
ncbi:hypothetical protein K457DRAFT_16886 [Linnemannia elongata AG-77]|uniref:F-box domain-containing protein n=1 Tax=Linnemannia elongata AG-77 TaxID=1314771 RepID=A0A197K5M9_9FUNG|nr:hypothetical protein K457DRAFT_16886 [Linnemannia elongata AG-77]